MLLPLSPFCARQSAITYQFGREAVFVPNDDIAYCEFRIAEEERLARLAPSHEAGSGHSQLAMLYRAQLTALYRSLDPDEQWIQPGATLPAYT
jgi:hypothetical protein